MLHSILPLILCTFVPLNLWTFVSANLCTFEPLDLWIVVSLSCWTFDSLYLWTFVSLNLWSFVPLILWIKIIQERGLRKRGFDFQFSIVWLFSLDLTIRIQVSKFVQVYINYLFEVLHSILPLMLWIKIIQERGLRQRGFDFQFSIVWFFSLDLTIRIIQVSKFVELYNNYTIHFR